MLDIAPGLLKRLRTILLRCGPFANDARLRNVFRDARISPWRNKLSSATSPEDRVDDLIDLLCDQENSETQENALALFLYVLADRVEPKDSCHQLISELARELQYTKQDIPDFDACEARMRWRVSLLKYLGHRHTFNEMQRISNELQSPEDKTLLWGRCLKFLSELPVTSDAGILKARIVHQLDIGEYTVHEIHELEETYRNDPKALKEIVREHYLLAQDIAHKKFERDLDDAKLERDQWQSNLEDLIASTETTSGVWRTFGSYYIDKDGHPTEDLGQVLQLARDNVESAEIRMHNLNFSDYYKKEIQLTLELALEAQRLEISDSSFSSLIVEMQEKINLE